MKTEMGEYIVGACIKLFKGIKKTIKQVADKLRELISKSILDATLSIVVYLFGLVTFLGIPLYIIARYQDPNFPPFELATVSALLGGFTLTGGFSNACPEDLRLRLRTIGALYLIATIAFILFGLYQPVDKMLKGKELAQFLGVIIPLSVYLGAFALTLAITWTLWIIPNIMGMEFLKRVISKIFVARGKTNHKQKAVKND